MRVRRAAQLAGLRAFLLAMVLCFSVALAQVKTDLSSIEIRNAWSDYRIGGAGTVDIFLELFHYASEGDRLIAVSAPLALKASLITVEAVNGQRIESVVPNVPIPPESGRLEFSKIGYFIRLQEFEIPLTMGTRFPLVLEFERAGPITVEVENRFHPPGLGERIIEQLNRAEP